MNNKLQKTYTRIVKTFIVTLVMVIAVMFGQGAFSQDEGIDPINFLEGVGILDRVEQYADTEYELASDTRVLYEERIVSCFCQFACYDVCEKNEVCSLPGYEEIQRDGFAYYKGNEKECECSDPANVSSINLRIAQSEAKLCIDEAISTYQFWKEQDGVCDEDAGETAELSPLDCLPKGDDISPQTPAEEQLKIFLRDIEVRLRQIHALVAAGQTKAAKEEAEGYLRAVITHLNKSMENRIDLSGMEKLEIEGKLRDVIDDVVIVEPGRGSYMGSCGFKGLWECLYLDPIDSPDTIRHELAHMITQAIAPYEYPTGNSSHDVTGYCSSQHRALDEALAHLFSANLVGKSKLETVVKGTELDVPAFQRNRTAGFDIDIANKQITTYTGSIQNVEVIDDNSDEWNEWNGPSNPDQLKTFSDQLSDLANRIDETIANGNNPRRVRTLVRLFSQRERVVSDPPAYSAKNEVAVASLLYDLTATKPSDQVVGDIIGAMEDFQSFKRRAPKSEKEVIQGILYRKGLGIDDPQFLRFYDIIVTKHKRKYRAEELILDPNFQRASNQVNQ
ncbi:hypothetical protein ACFL2D_01440 [Patescibacteria group bacterium]